MFNTLNLNKKYTFISSMKTENYGKIGGVLDYLTTNKIKI